MNRFRFVLANCFLFFGICTNAIASAPTVDSTNEIDLSDKYHTPVYAKLEKVGDTYRFTNFSAVPLPASINLIDLRPTFDTQKYPASKLFFICPVINTKDHKRTNLAASCPEGFRKYRTNIPLTGAYWVGSFGLALAVGNCLGDSYFDEDAYGKAISEACTDPTFDRKNLLAQYSAITEKADLAYNNFTNKDLDIKWKITDASEIYHAADIRPSEMKSAIRILKSSFIPFKNQKNSYPSSLDFINAAKTQPGVLTEDIPCTFDIHYSTTNIKGYNVTSNGANRVDWSPTQPNTITVEIKINSKNIHNLVPNYSNQDSNITISSRDSDLKISNKTKRYITLRSISLYQDNNILNNSSEIELPPQSTKSLSIDRTFINFTPKNYYDVTKNTAQNTFTSWGFAVKYDIIGTGESKTLFSENKHSLYSLIK